MLKNKLDYKLLNAAIIMVIIFLLYQTGNLWLGIIGKIGSIIFPFFLAFILAYALYPILKYLQSKKIPKGISVTIIVVSLLLLLGIIIAVIVPMIFKELPSLFSGIISFIKEISTKFSIDSSSIQMTLQNSFNQIVSSMGKYVSDGAINMIGVSLNYLTIIFIAFAASIYLLIDMDKIRSKVKHFLKKTSKRMYGYVVALDNEMKNYLIGFTRIIFITFFEYTIVYSIIGHPNAILLGVLAMIANLIPYFGGVITNTIAAITSFVISPALFWKTVVTFLILSSIDGYVINPYIYGKTNRVHPLVVILSVFAGGILFGTLGILLSLPLAILIITTIQYFDVEVKNTIEDIKEKI